MGLRSPQEMNRVVTQAAPNSRIQGTQAPQLDKTFLAVASKAVSANQEAARRDRAEQLDFVKTQTDNDTENDVIQANAELSQAEGLNTLDKSMALREKLKTSFDKRKQKIPEQFHPYVDQIFEQKMTRYNKFAVPYTLSQVNKVKDEADKTYAANSINEAIEESGDLNGFNDALAKVTFAVAKRAQKKFGDQPELIQEAISLGNSEAIRRSIEQQAVIGRFDKANQLLEWGDAELTAKDRVKAIKLMSQAKDDQGDKEASDLANAAATQYPDDIEKQELWIRSTAKVDKVERAATAFLRSRVAVQKIAKERKLESTYAKINDAVAKGEDPTPHIMDLPPGPEGREKAFKWINETRGGRSVVTDFATFDKLNDRITNAVTASQLPDSLLDSYRHKISPDNMKVLESKFDRLKSKENAEQQRVHRLNYKLAEDTFSAWATQNGLSAKSKRDDRATAKIAMMEEVERVLTINPKVSSRDLNSRILNTLREKGMKEKKVERFFGLFPDKTIKEVNPSLSDDSPKVHSSWFEAIHRADSSLNESQVNATIQTLIRNGKDVSAPR